MEQPQHSKTCVRFAQGTKNHDGLRPVSFIVETCVASVFEGKILNQKQFTELLLRLIEQSDLDIEATLQMVLTCLQDLVVRCRKSRSERGTPILINGGGKGLYIPKSSVKYIQRLVMWVNRIDVKKYFEVEVTV